MESLFEETYDVVFILIKTRMYKDIDINCSILKECTQAAFLDIAFLLVSVSCETIALDLFSSEP
jgi:hypothetical protein